MTAEFFSLTGKVALVTGAYGYLGAAIVEGLAQAGAKVLINGRNKEKVDQLVVRLTDEGYLAESAVFDVTNSNAITEYIRHSQLSSLDVLIHNAYAGGLGSIETSTEDQFRNSYEISLVAVNNLTQICLPYLKRAKQFNNDASVITVASMYGMVSPDCRIYSSKDTSNPPFYGAAKAALIQWTKYAACEFGKDGIRFNAISPGPFPSKNVRSTNKSLVDKIKLKVPMNRVGETEELKGPVVFLASAGSSYMTGTNLVVDGGWTAW
jgi:NAD(P)-dependent dehydrogenase (short-subunit alcohol dehydrogenase family)